jgi:putative flippase GtrA
MTRPATLDAVFRWAWLATKFGLVGAASAAVYFLCLFVLRPFLFSTIILTAISYIVSAVFNFLAQSSFTFRVKTGAPSMPVRFIAMHGVCLVLNSALMNLAVDVLGQGLFLSQIAVSLFVALVSFAMSASWVFRRR